MGRNRIGDDLKKKMGTFQKSRSAGKAVETELLRELPKPPIFMGKHAKALYLSIGNELIEHGVLGKVDLSMFQSYCMQMGTYIECEIALKKEGRIMTLKNGYKQAHPLVAISTQSLAIALKVGASFGLSPAARPKIPTQKKEPEMKSKILSLIPQKNK